MDSEKYLKLEKLIETGGSPSDEGPFYHHSFWEAYKGSIKGKLGGIVLGMLMGGLLGSLVAGAMAVGLLGSALATSTAVGAAFIGLTGAGILYGMVEFGEIGKIVGAQAATQEQADAREAIRFSAIERKIDALTEAVSGKTGKPVEKVDTSRETEALATYRKTHYARLNGSTKGPLFWKIALIGFAVGALAGLILAMPTIGAVAGAAAAEGAVTSAAGHIFVEGLGLKFLTAETIPLVSALTFGAFGASFGLNRDYFRKIFDVTDLWTKGIFSSKKVDELQTEAGHKFEKANGLSHDKKDADVATAVAPESGYLDYPASATFHRDRAIKNSERALQELDHTRATPH